MQLYTKTGAVSTSLGVTETGEGISESTSDQRAREFAWIEKGKESVREKLKDPDSAQFEDVFFNRGEDDLPITCGKVNSKNSFGGYNGFQRFLSAGSSELTYLEEQVQDFGVVWKKFCTGAEGE